MAINLAGVKLKRAVIYAVAFVFIYGCAATPSVKDVEDLNVRLKRLEASRGESEARVEELESKLLLFREKLDSREQGGLDISGIEEQDLTPPEGLKVIRLGEGTLTIKGSSDTAERPAVISKGPPAKGSPRAVDGAGGSRREAISPSEPPEAIYKKGRSLYLSGSYLEARVLFSRISTLYPESSLADNALYWSGETLYREKDFSKALVMFRLVVEQYPRGNKVSDSLLKMGLCYEKTGEREKAVAVLKRLVDEYPRSEAAVTASKRLNSL